MILHTSKGGQKGEKTISGKVFACPVAILRTDTSSGELNPVKRMISARLIPHISIFLVLSHRFDSDFPASPT